MNNAKIFIKRNTGQFLLRLLWTIIIFFLPVFSPESLYATTNNASSFLSYEIVNTYPHDPTAFTQGLVWQKGNLFEGTGLYGSSELRKTELDSGRVLQYYCLDKDYFGEGITIFKDRIYQLTWKEQTGFIYDLKTFKLLDTFSYPYEGWGITHDGTNLIISDGSQTIHFVDPVTMEEVKQISVHYGLYLLYNLNELEYINGKIFANIWLTTRIAIIDPDTGEVVNFLDLAEIVDSVKLKSRQAIDVLNGIAYDEDKKHLFITGKLWPELFEIRIIEKFS